MVTFQSKPYGQTSAFSPLAAKAKKRPFLFFGLPFLAIMVAGSFGLSQLTQTKFDHRDRRHTKVIIQIQPRFLFNGYLKFRKSATGS
jgi:cytochrome c oxidase assembly protein subunit 16